jgi:hypothetical protein
MRRIEMSGAKRLCIPAVMLLLGLMVPANGRAREYKYSIEERIVLTRDLTAEFATAKVTLPRSKKALPFDAEAGQSDLGKWSDAHQEFGPAARMGDMIQITKIKFEKKRLLLQINGGFKGGRKWYDRLQVGGGMGGGMSPIGRGNSGGGPAGTSIALDFPDGVPELDAVRVKELLIPLLDFEQHSATEQFVETLPAPQQAAVEEKRAIEGMDRDTVMLAMGKPERKIRETEDDVEYEDWIYGTPPGKVTFVKFRGSKVVQVKESYGGIGGSVAAPLPAQ